MTYVVEETKERVGDGKPALRTRSYRRAMRRRDKLNAQILFPSYRYEVVAVSYGARWGARWEVVAFQNRAKPS